MIPTSKAMLLSSFFSDYAVTQWKWELSDKVQIFWECKIFLIKIQLFWKFWECQNKVGEFLDFFVAFSQYLNCKNRTKYRLASRFRPKDNFLSKRIFLTKEISQDNSIIFFSCSVPNLQQLKKRNGFQKSTHIDY